MNSLAKEKRIQQRVTIHSPVGPLTLYAENESILEVRFGKGSEFDEGKLASASKQLSVLKQAIRELSEYFEGDRTDFSVPLAIRGTPFQNRVWNELIDIPFGETCSYSDMARRIGSPQSFRAVGVALGRNPIAILVPCHRVIGADGSLVGFGGGLPIKRKLLEHEARSR